ncbi:hypothetical protein CLU79DRAFT_891356, partial [Phycomyces nitens]
MSKAPRITRDISNNEIFHWLAQARVIIAIKIIIISRPLVWEETRRLFFPLTFDFDTLLRRPCLRLDNSLSSKPLVKTVAMQIKTVKPNTLQAL